MTRKCKTCNTPFTGRADKKYCSDYCRCEFNNKRYRGFTDALTKTNRQLKKNHKVLIQLVNNGEKSIHITELTSLGFNFNLFTGVNRVNSEIAEFYCYDFGLKKSPNGQIEIYKLTNKQRTLK